MKARKHAILLVAAAGVMAMTVGAGAAGAAAAAARAPMAFGTVRSSATPAVTLPTSNLTLTGSTLSFVPSSLNAVWSGPTAEGCTKALEVVRIQNTTTTYQTIVLAGEALQIPPGKGTGVCFWGSGTAAATFHVKGHILVKLKVHLS
jgi:ABC-type sugar transport system substrate-binding protein